MNEQIVNFLAVVGAGTILYLIYKAVVSFSLVNYAIVSKFSGHPISLINLVLMRIRKVNVASVVNSYIILRKNEIPIALADLEVASLAGRSLENITQGLVAAKSKGLLMTFQQAIEADATGRKITELLDSSDKKEPNKSL